MQIGIGVIGATGFIGTPYRKEIREAGGQGRMVALCARRKERLLAAAAEDGAVVATHEWQAVVEHPDVKLVLVLTPDALHYDPVIATAELGKHLVCEKPVGVDAAQSFAMWQAVKRAEVFHFVPFWTRYHPIFIRAKQIIAEGRLGTVQGIIYRWHNPRPIDTPFTWRDDAELSAAGSIADVGSHAYDALRFLLGEEVQQVMAHADTIMPPKADLGEIDLGEAIAWGQQHVTADAQQQQLATTPDFCQLLFKYASGVRGVMVLAHASYYRKGFAPEVELHGTLGSLAIDRINGNILFSDSTEPAQLAETVAGDLPENRFADAVFPALSKHFSGEPSEHPDMEDGFKVQVFVDAVVASARQHTWVSLKEVEEAAMVGAAT